MNPKRLKMDEKVYEKMGLTSPDKLTFEEKEEAQMFYGIYCATAEFFGIKGEPAEIKLSLQEMKEIYNGLTEVRQWILKKRYLDRCSLKEIGDLLRVSHSAIGTREYVALKPFIRAMENV